MMLVDSQIAAKKAFSLKRFFPSIHNGYAAQIQVLGENHVKELLWEMLGGKNFQSFAPNITYY